SPLKNTWNRSTSTTTPHTPATLLNTKKIPFNFSFAQTLVWANTVLEQKSWPNLTRLWERRRLKYSWITSSALTSW
ncbi:hypothetical protein CWN74_28635, partial [Klebsiella pneumoniae]